MATFPSPLPLPSQQQCHYGFEGDASLTNVSVSNALQEATDISTDQDKCWSQVKQCSPRTLSEFSPNLDTTYRYLLDLTLKPIREHPIREFRAAFEPYRAMVLTVRNAIDAHENAYDKTQTAPILDDYLKQMELEIPLIPQPPCQQIVLGTMEDLVVYVMYVRCQVALGKIPSFSILATNDWTPEINQEFVSCALPNTDKSCEFNIRMLLPKQKDRILTKDGQPRITKFEVCILLAMEGKYNGWEYVGSKTPPHHACLKNYRILFLRDATNQTPVRQGGGYMRKINWKNLIRRNHRTKKRRTVTRHKANKRNCSHRSRKRT
jgi:hypothetical protein